MHPMRAISAVAVCIAAACYSTKLLGTLRLNEVMSADEQQKTGVANLSDAQKKELESWINNRFVLKTTSAAQSIYLQQNIQGGTQLMFSDGSLYEIAPTDRAKATFWLTPIAVTMEPSGDPNYPSKITNTLTNVSVNGKMIKAPQSSMTPQQ
ncbi:MAG: hypothetical protein JSS10_06945 [Verrucomicrobia bacterium]|nr:hypothetical protein [Verrucomicrobiota bacterium]